MHLLDTDHLSILERGGEASMRLRRRLSVLAPDQVAATMISYEEQTRGWLAFLAKARSLDEQATAHGYLQRHLQIFCAFPLLPFDAAAAAA